MFEQGKVTDYPDFFLFFTNKHAAQSTYIVY